MKSRARLAFLALGAVAVSSAFANEELVSFSARKDTTFTAILTYRPESPPAYVAVLDAARRFPNVPVIVIGHSNSTQSAAYVAAVEQKKIQGIVLIEGRFAWINYNDKFFDGNGLSKFDWSSIKVPVLIIQHRKDDCFAMPYEAAAKVAEHNRAFQFVTIDPPGSVATGECTYKGTHNLVGQETVVADDMLDWFKAMVKGEAAH